MLKNILKKFLKVILILCLVLSAKVYAADEGVMDQAADALGLKDAIEILEEYSEELDLNDLAEDLLKGEGLDLKQSANLITDIIFKEIKVEIKTCVSILLVIVLIAVIKCLELEKGGLEKVINVVGFLVVTSMILKNYIEVLEIFKTTVSNIVNITEVISPIILGILIATGEAVTSGIIGPVIMFLTALTGVVMNYIILPLLNISLAFKIITSISEAINLNRLGNLFKSSAMWITSIMFALVLGVLGLETTVSTSVDAVAVKTTQAAVSNLIPVVGKFVSDSAELIMGASEVIGKTIGVLGIIVIVVLLLAPAIKLLIIGLIYSFLEAMSETLLADEKITNTIGAFAKQYNCMAGIMVGIGTVFVITLALVINLFGKVTGG